jgi:uncharacterized protein
MDPFECAAVRARFAAGSPGPQLEVDLSGWRPDGRRPAQEIHCMKTLDLATLALVIIGALNWLLVGLFEFDLVATITGDDFGETNIISRIIYVLVGLSGIYLLTMLARIAGRDDVR